ncbi:putative cell wall protein [Helianthus annuus]|nr:putative cell wall protein [Helianthus annuus]
MDKVGECIGYKSTSSAFYSHPKLQVFKKMAKTVVALFVFNLLISVTMAGRNIPNAKPDDDKHTKSLLYYDRGYLIPGVGRGITPKPNEGFNPVTYNPITGSNNGFPGITVPSVGGLGGGNYLPGGDDTLIPNPGFEVPIPGGIGNTPVAAAARP